MPRNASLPQIKMQAPAARPRAAPPAPAARLRPDACAAEVLAHASSSGTLLVCDFDRTLTDWDAGERLCDELAPELTSLLSSLQMPACFVPVTNTGAPGPSARRALRCARRAAFPARAAASRPGLVPALPAPPAPPQCPGGPCSSACASTLADTPSLPRAVLGEMHRRGVSRDRLVACLREMGREVPLPTARMLQVRGRVACWGLYSAGRVQPACMCRPAPGCVSGSWRARSRSRCRQRRCARPQPALLLQWASARGLPTVILSDCNATFIHHILTGAKVLDCVRQVGAARHFRTSAC